MTDEWVAICETDECGWQGNPQGSHFGAVCDIANHRIKTGSHDGRVYPADEVSDSA